MQRLRNSFFLLISAAAAASAAPPARVEIGYQLERNGSALADITTRLEHANGAYQLTETWRGKGVYALRGDIKRSSRGRVAAEGLKPLEFADERTGRDTARARFDWSGGKLTLQYKGEPQTMPLPPNGQDRISYLFNFAFQPPGKQPVNVALTDGRGLSSHVYQAAGQERLKTPAGEFNTLKLARVEPGERKTEIWLATERSQLPVRILIVEKDGTRLDQVATRIASP